MANVSQSVLLLFDEKEAVQAKKNKSMYLEANSSCGTFSQCQLYIVAEGKDSCCSGRIYRRFWVPVPLHQYGSMAIYCDSSLNSFSAVQL